MHPASARDYGRLSLFPNQGDYFVHESTSSSYRRRNVDGSVATSTSSLTL
jgi:hypothetical protein